MNMKRFLILILLLSPVASFGASPLDVRINEFSSQPASGNSWVELINRSGSNINLSGWQISHLATNEFGSTTVATTTLDDLSIPSGGLVSFSFDLATSSDNLILADESGLVIDNMIYPDYLMSGVAPAAGQSAYSFGSEGGSPWKITDTPTPKWFNETATPPTTKQTILDAIASSSVTTNLIADSDWTDFSGLTLTLPDHGQLVWAGPLNLTGSADRAILQNLSTSINFDTGYINASGTLATASSTFTSLAPVVVPPVTPPSGDGGSSGGGGGGSSVATTATTTVTTTPLVGRVLGENVFRFTKQLKFGMRGTDVGELQKRLKLEGFYLAKITNIFNGTTKEAVIKYQQKYKIKPASGVVGKLTLVQLNKNTGGEIASGDVKSMIADLSKQIAVLKKQLAALGSLR